MKIPVFKKAGSRVIRCGAVELGSLRGAYPERELFETYFDSDSDLDFYLYQFEPTDDGYVVYGCCKSDLDLDLDSDPDDVPMNGEYNFGNTEGFRRSIAVGGDSYALDSLWFHGFRMPRSWKHQKTKWSWREKRRMRRFQKEHLKDSIPASFLKGVESHLSAYERYSHDEGALP